MMAVGITCGSWQVSALHAMTGGTWEKKDTEVQR